MAYFSLHAYDADVWVPGFLGLNQADIGLNPDVRFAAEAENVETPDGVLQPGADMTLLPGEFEGRIETLANFYRRWYTGSGSREWLIAAEAGKIYYRQAGSDTEWMDIELPTGVDSFSNNVWSCVTYEITENGITVDVLLISNADDGMYMIVPPDRPANWADIKEHDWDWVKAKTWGELKSPRWVMRTVDTKGKKFGTIARYAERIWGGNVADNPDMLMYSAPYDPTDWEQNLSIPEDGAGDVMQPSWDGTSFTGLQAFGDQLIAFKQSRVWRIIGTDPGEYEFKEQYGGGSPYKNTIVSDTERIFMADNEGLSIYDGMSVTPYQRPKTEQLWRKINRSAMDQMVAAVFRQRLYLAFPEGDSTVNNALLVYNFETGTILYYSDIYIESLLATNEKLYATSSSTPGKLYEVEYDSWVSGKVRAKASRWISPWIDFGYKRIQKGGFDFYFIPEVQEEPVTLQISIQTEKKKKTKTYTIQPLTEEQKTAEKEHKGKRLHFGGAGRKFRFIIETEDGVTAPWRLIGGIQMVVETDPD